MCGAIEALGVLREARLHATFPDRLELLATTVTTGIALGFVLGLATGSWAQRRMVGALLI